MVGYESRPKKMYHPWLPLDLFLSYFQVRMVARCYQQKLNQNHDLPCHGLLVEGLGIPRGSNDVLWTPFLQKEPYDVFC